MEKYNLIKARTINETNSSSQINLAHLKFLGWWMSCRLSNLSSPLIVSEGFAYEKN